MTRKGIILSGGKGTRLFPTTIALSKQLLPIYDKPMIYYPLSTLMSIGIQEILIITTPMDLERFEYLLGDGSKWGINITFKVQEKPNGIAEAFILAENFIKNSDSALILGDNLFYGHNLPKRLKMFSSKSSGATIFAYPVKNPERYGIVNFDKEKIISIQEKPKNTHSKQAVTGLYFYDKTVINISKNLKPSKRGELEITDLNNIYLEQNKLEVCFLDKGDTWLDAGSNESLIEASQFIQAIQNRQGIKIASPEEIAWKNGWIDNNQLRNLAKKLLNNEYGKYLLNLSEI